MQKVSNKSQCIQSFVAFEVIYSLTKNISKSRSTIRED